MTSLTLDNSTIPVSEAKKDRECERESGWKKVEEKITTSVSFTLPFLLWSVSAMLWKLCAMYVNESYRDIFFEWNGATAKKRHIMHKQYINSHSSIERERARLPLQIYRRNAKKMFCLANFAVLSVNKFEWWHAATAAVEMFLSLSHTHTLHAIVWKFNPQKHTYNRQRAAEKPGTGLFRGYMLQNLLLFLVALYLCVFKLEAGILMHSLRQYEL